MPSPTALVGGGLGAAAAAVLLSAYFSTRAHQQQRQVAWSPLRGDATLLRVAVVHRHGARAPLNTSLGDVQWTQCDGASPLAMAVSHADTKASRPVSARDAAQQTTRLPGGCRMGELTVLGERQALELGRRLRAAYGQPLFGASREPGPGELLVRSTNLQRTLATAQAVLRGLLGGGDDALQAHTLLTLPDADEWLYPNTEGCAALRRSWSAARRGLDEGGAWSRGLEHHLEALRAALPAGRAAGRDGAGASGSEAAAGGLGDGGGAGSPSSAAADAADAAAALLATPWGAVALLDHVAARHAHGLPPVGGLATAVQVDALRAVAAAVVARTMLAPGGEGGVGGGDAAAAARLRMSTGRLLGTLMDLMRAKEGDAPRLALFSAHDTTVLPLLLALQGDATGGGGDNLRQPELAWPPFASAVAVELWRAPAAPSAGGGLFVRALHDGEVVVMPCAAMPSAYLGGKGGACSLADWLAAIAPIAAAGPDEHAAECAGQPRKPAKAAP